jgi:opacity protein-like surface antigen
VSKLVVAAALALALPSGAQAADYVILYVTPTKIAPGWTLGGSVASGSFYYGTDDVFGLTLRRGFAGGQAARRRIPSAQITAGRHSRSKAGKVAGGRPASSERRSEPR